MKTSRLLVGVLAVLAIWVALAAIYVGYLESWRWGVEAFECGARLLRFTRGPCLPDAAG